MRLGFGHGDRRGQVVPGRGAVECRQYDLCPPVRALGVPVDSIDATKWSCFMRLGFGHGDRRGQVVPGRGVQGSSEGSSVEAEKLPQIVRVGFRRQFVR